MKGVLEHAIDVASLGRWRESELEQWREPAVEATHASDAPDNARAAVLQMIQGLDRAAHQHAVQQTFVGCLALFWIFERPITKFMTADAAGRLLGVSGPVFLDRASEVEAALMSATDQARATVIRMIEQIESAANRKSRPTVEQILMTWLALFWILEFPATKSLTADECAQRLGCSKPVFLERAARLEKAFGVRPQSAKSHDHRANLSASLRRRHAIQKRERLTS